jgi:molecular chaperone DnaK (HSP70)
MTRDGSNLAPLFLGEKMQGRSVIGFDFANLDMTAVVVAENGIARIKAHNGRDHAINAIALRNDEWLVGEDAVRHTLAHPTEGLVSGLKKFLAEDPTQSVEISGKSFGVVDLASTYIQMAFPTLRNESKMSPVVLTWPTGSSPATQKALVEAFESAGINLLRDPRTGNPAMIDEAQALAFVANDQIPEAQYALGETVVVVDIGHRTCDISRLHVVPAKIGGGMRLETGANDWIGANLGGSIIDEQIVEEIRNAHPDCPELSNEALKAAARATKVQWAQGQTPTYLLSWFATNGGVLSWQRELTIEMRANILARYNEQLAETLAPISGDTVNHLVFGGGMSNLADLRQLFVNILQPEKVHTIPRPHLATALGAAIFGARVIGIKKVRYEMTPTVRRDIVLFKGASAPKVVIPEGTELGSENAEKVFKLPDNHGEIVLRIAQASAPKSIAETTTPVYFIVEQNMNYIRVNADFGGISVALSKEQFGPFTPVNDLSWLSRLGVDNELKVLQNVVETARK